MGRLIDTDEIFRIAQGEFSEDDMFKIRWLISHIPTAYDVEAVVAELENMKTGGDCRHKCKHYDWSVGSCEGYCEDYLREKAIEIVRNGGKE